MSIFSCLQVLHIWRQTNDCNKHKHTYTLLPQTASVLPSTSTWQDASASIFSDCCTLCKCHVYFYLCRIWWGTYVLIHMMKALEPLVCRNEGEQYQNELSFGYWILHSATLAWWTLNTLPWEIVFKNDLTLSGSFWKKRYLQCFL